MCHLQHNFPTLNFSLDTEIVYKFISQKIKKISNPEIHLNVHKLCHNFANHFVINIENAFVFLDFLASTNIETTMIYSLKNLKIKYAKYSIISSIEHDKQISLHHKNPIAHVYKGFPVEIKLI